MNEIAFASTVNPDGTVTFAWTAPDGQSGVTVSSDPSDPTLASATAWDIRKPPVATGPNPWPGIWQWAWAKAQEYWAIWRAGNVVLPPGAGN